MRKRSKYRPKPIILDCITYVKTGFTPMVDMKNVLLNLQLKNHSALEALRVGDATKEDIDTIISALNITEALSMQGIGDDYKEEIKEAQDALFECAKRGAENYKFVVKGLELKAINYAMELHDAQLHASTVRDIEKAIDTVKNTIIQKKARAIVEKSPTKSGEKAENLL